MLCACAVCFSQLSKLLAAKTLSHHQESWYHKLWFIIRASQRSVSILITSKYTFNALWLTNDKFLDINCLTYLTFCNFKVHLLQEQGRLWVYKRLFWLDLLIMSAINDGLNGIFSITDNRFWLHSSNFFFSLRWLDQPSSAPSLSFVNITINIV